MLLLSGVLVSLLNALLVGKFNETTIGYLLKYTHMQAGGDSWKPMIKAIEQLRGYPDSPVYNEIFFQQGIKFQYPLSALLFLDIPQRVTGWTWASLILVVNNMCWLCVPAMCGMFGFLFWNASLTAASQTRQPLSQTYRRFVPFLAIAFVCTFYPFLRSYHLGQIQTPLTLVASLAVVAWQRQKFGWAGVFVGICCAIKPQWILILPWAVLHKQWRMTIAASITAGTLLLLSVIRYGASNMRDYLSVLSFLGKHGESFYPNQSMNGLFNRLLFNGNNLNWEGHSFPPFHPVVSIVTICSSILILLLVLLWKAGKTPNVFDFCIVILGLTLASPIAWEHHYGILLPILAVVLPTAISQQPFGAWTTPYVWLAFILTSQNFNGIANKFAYTHWNFVQSYLLVGAFMILYLLFRLSNSKECAPSAARKSDEIKDRVPPRSQVALGNAVVFEAVLPPN